MLYRGQRHVRLGATAVVVTALTLAAGLLLGTRLDNDTARAVPAEGSVDAGFSRDMQEHHAQAVQISTLVRVATDDPEVRTLALDILLTQQQQAGQMSGWPAAWRLTQTSSSRPMGWMRSGTGTESGGVSTHGGSHGSMGASTTTDASMPGMASKEDLARLAAAREVEAGLAGLVLIPLAGQLRRGRPGRGRASITAVDSRVTSGRQGDLS